MFEDIWTEVGVLLILFIATSSSLMVKHLKGGNCCHHSSPVDYYLLIFINKEIYVAYTFTMLVKYPVLRVNKPIGCQLDGSQSF